MYPSNLYKEKNMETQLIIGPLVGAIIGLITNGIALKMIFRPLYTKYLWGWKIPFTPGIIPKEKGRIATSIGNAISINLMNKETLEKTLLSKEMLSKLENTVDNYIQKLSTNEQTLQEYLYGLLSKKEIDLIIANTKEDLTSVLQKELSNPQLGDQVSSIVVAHALSKVKEGLLGFLGVDKFINLIALPAELLLAKNINEMLANNSHQLIHDLLDKGTDRLMSMKICEIAKEHTQQIEAFKKYIISAYQKIISEQLPRILSTINISKVIEERINEMDVKEVEQLLFQIMDKELKAIVWLGGLLGFIMGFINVII